MIPPPKDGRDAQTPYRARVGDTWYWVDPQVPRAAIEAGDTVVVYPVSGHAVIAVVQGYRGPHALTFANLEGKLFEVKPSDIAAMHLAAVDDHQ